MAATTTDCFSKGKKEGEAGKQASGIPIPAIYRPFAPTLSFALKVVW